MEERFASGLTRQAIGVGADPNGLMECGNTGVWTIYEQLWSSFVGNLVGNFVGNFVELVGQSDKQRNADSSPATGL